MRDFRVMIDLGGGGRGGGEDGVVATSSPDIDRRGDVAPTQAAPRAGMHSDESIRFALKSMGKPDDEIAEVLKRSRNFYDEQRGSKRLRKGEEDGTRGVADEDALLAALRDRLEPLSVPPAVFALLAENLLVQLGDGDDSPRYKEERVLFVTAGPRALPQEGMGEGEGGGEGGRAEADPLAFVEAEHDAIAATPFVRVTRAFGLEDARAKLEAAHRAGEPITALHVSAHGVRLGVRLVERREEGSEVTEEGRTLIALVDEFAGRGLACVALMACWSHELAAQMRVPSVSCRTRLLDEAAPHYARLFYREWQRAEARDIAVKLGHSAAWTASSWSDLRSAGGGRFALDREPPPGGVAVGAEEVGVGVIEYSSGTQQSNPQVGRLWDDFLQPLLVRLRGT